MKEFIINNRDKLIIRLRYKICTFKMVTIQNELIFIKSENLL